MFIDKYVACAKYQLACYANMNAVAVHFGEGGGGGVLFPCQCNMTKANVSAMSGNCFSPHREPLSNVCLCCRSRRHYACSAQ